METIKAGTVTKANGLVRVTAISSLNGLPVTVELDSKVYAILENIPETGLAPKAICALLAKQGFKESQARALISRYLPEYSNSCGVNLLTVEHVGRGNLIRFNKDFMPQVHPGKLTKGPSAKPKADLELSVEVAAVEQVDLQSLVQEVAALYSVAQQADSAVETTDVEVEVAE